MGATTGSRHQVLAVTLDGQYQALKPRSEPSSLAPQGPGDGLGCPWEQVLGGTFPGEQAQPRGSIHYHPWGQSPCTGRGGKGRLGVWLLEVGTQPQERRAGGLSGGGLVCAYLMGWGQARVREIWDLEEVSGVSIRRASPQGASRQDCWAQVVTWAPQESWDLVALPGFSGRSILKRHSVSFGRADSLVRAVCGS